METMQQPKIIGYRELSEGEAILINEIKQVANTVGELVERVAMLPQIDDAGRWAAIGKTQLQQGFMALIRSVARPDSF